MIASFLCFTPFVIPKTSIDGAQFMLYNACLYLWTIFIDRIPTVRVQYTTSTEDTYDGNPKSIFLQNYNQQSDIDHPTAPVQVLHVSQIVEIPLSH